MDRPGSLVLADGRIFEGVGFGAAKTVVAEVVFNTAMSGYQEVLSDPSYAGQFVCFTAPEIGNVGTNPEDDESGFGTPRNPGRAAEGALVRSLSPVVSNWRSQGSLPQWMETRGIGGLADIDTRALTRHIRDRGATMAALCTEPGARQRHEELLALARSATPMEGRDMVRAVTCAEPYEWDEPSWGEDNPPPATLHVVAYDFGIKRNILRMLRDCGIRVTVVPAATPYTKVLDMKPDGVFLSNGPGDPAALGDVVEEIRGLLEATAAEREGPHHTPIFGICLGHQLLCLALGGETFKLPFGHHGANHPVRDEHDKSVAITAQNHGFAVAVESLEGAGGARVTHVNLFDQTVAGLEHSTRPIFGVQFHPEASPGPHDAAPVFQRFARLMRG